MALGGKVIVPGDETFKFLERALARRGRRSHQEPAPTHNQRKGRQKRERRGPRRTPTLHL